MAIVFSYPPIGFKDVQASDRLLLSQMTVYGNPTRSVTVNTLRQYLGAIIPTNIVIGSGTTNKITKWVNGAAGQIGDSSIEDTGSEINVPYKLNINNATSNADGIVFPHPAGGASGIVNMYYNGAAAGSRFVISRAATGGAEIELQSNGDVNVNRLGNGNFLVGGEVTLDDYGSGAITGTPTFNLEVDANGKIIETASGGVTGTGASNNMAYWDGVNSITYDSTTPFVYLPMGGGGMVAGRLGLGTSSPNFKMDIAGGDLRIEENYGIRFGGTGSNGQNYNIRTTGDPFGGNYPGAFVISRGALATQIDFTLKYPNAAPRGQVQFNQYGSGNFTGTAAFGLSVDASGNIIETASAAAGYKSVQVFQWPNGTPVAYTNWTNGVASNIPFNATPLVERGTYSGTPANFAWTCVNNAGGTATQEAQFTLGANGAGTWQIDTCQHWFDQTNQVEIRVSFQFTSGGVTQQIDVIDEKSTELSGDKIFYGSLVREFVATDKIEVEVEFVSGGVNPFPSDSGNRPIEITFTKLV